MQERAQAGPQAQAAGQGLPPAGGEGDADVGFLSEPDWASGMIPLESPVPEIGTLGSVSGERVARHEGQ